MVSGLDSRLRGNDGARMSEAQRRVYECIVALTARCGYPPTIREIGRAIGRSNCAVKDALDRLVCGGWIERKDGAARGIRIIQKDEG